MPQPRSHIIPPALLYLLFAVGVGVAVYLVPKDSELFQRLLADGKEERARELAQAVGDDASQHAAAPGGPGAAGGQAEPPADSGTATIVSFGLEDLRGRPLEPGDVARIEPLIGAVSCPAKTLMELALRCRELDEGDAERLYRLLIRRALADEDPATATRICDYLREHLPSPSPDTVRSMVQSYRYASEVVAAIATLESLALRHRALPDDLADTLVALYLENSQPGKAFDQLRARIERTNDPDVLLTLLARAVQAAQFAGRLGETTSLYISALDHLPENHLSIRELAERRTDGGGVGRESKYRQYAYRFAESCEWGGAADTAFDYYRKAAALGHERAIDRCVALHAGLMRHEDLADLLLLLQEDDLSRIDGYPLLLANLLGRAARYEEAQPYYLAHLADNPDDSGAIIALAATHEELGNLEECLAGYQHALELQPDDIGLRRRVAETQIALGRHEGAFATLRETPEDAHSQETLEHLVMLAESLADYPAYNRALQLQLRRQKNPPPQAYLDLAESYALIGDKRAELATFREAVRANPKSRTLALALADCLYREDLFAEAMHLLTRPDLRDHTQALSMFIEICGGGDEFAFAARHLPSGIEDHHDFAPSVRIELAEIYESTGDNRSAEKLYASVPEGGEAWQLLASLKYRKGDLSRAEQYQKKYLSAASEPDAQSWVFMGDIYKGLGKEQLADDAYNRSLKLLKSRL